MIVECRKCEDPSRLRCPRQPESRGRQVEMGRRSKEKTKGRKGAKKVGIIRLGKGSQKRLARLAVLQIKTLSVSLDERVCPSSSLDEAARVKVRLKC